jgi:hypothetical protein
MSLAIVPLVGPMYSIYNYYKDIYKRYGEHIYINTILNASEVVTNKIVIPQYSAPLSILDTLIVIMYENLIKFQSMRYRLSVDKTKKEKSMALSYYVPFITILIIVSFGIIGVVIYKWKGDEITNGKKNSMYLSIIALTLIIMSILISFASKRLVYYNTLVTTVNCTTFMADKAISLEPYLANFITNLLPASLQLQCINATRDLTYDVLSQEMLTVIAPVKGSKKCKSSIQQALDNSSDANLQYVMISRFLFVKGLITMANYDALLKKYTHADKLHSVSGLFISKQSKTPDESEQRTWHPIKFYKSIEQLDIIEQTRQLSKAMTGLSQFMLKTHDMGLLENIADKTNTYVERVTWAFNKVGITINEDLAITDVGKYMQKDDNAKNAEQCMQSCFLNNNCKISYYGDGVCYTGSNIDLPYTYTDSNASTKVYNSTYIKEFPTGTSSNVSVLKKAYGVLNMQEMFKLRQDDIAKQISYVMDEADPVVVVIIDEDLLDRILTKVVAYHMITTNEFKDLVKNITKRAQTIQKDRYNISKQVQGASSKYIDMGRFKQKLSELTEDQFYNGFARHCFSTYTSIRGLKSIYDTYDLRAEQKDYKASVVLNWFWLIGLIGLTLFANYWIKYAYENVSLNASLAAEAQVQAKAKAQASTVPKQQQSSDLTIGYLKRKLRLHANQNQDSSLQNTEKDKKLMKQLYIEGLSFTTIHIALIGTWFVVLVFLYTTYNRIQDINNRNIELMNNNTEDIRICSVSVATELFQNGLLQNQIINTGKDFSVGFPMNIYVYDAYANAVSLSLDRKVGISDAVSSSIYYCVTKSLDAYEKCNLINNFELSVPFPVYETTIYGTIIIFCIIVALLVFMYTKPGKMLKNIKYWRRIKEQMDNNIIVPVEEMNIGNAGEVHEMIKFILLIAAPIIIVITVILLVVNLFNGSTQLSNALNFITDCYKL